MCVLMIERIDMLESNRRDETLRAPGTLPPGKSLVRTSTVEHRGVSRSSIITLLSTKLCTRLTDQEIVPLWLSSHELGRLLERQVGNWWCSHG